MDISEDAPLCRFGTPLEPLEEDDIPSKKPVAIEDQIVTDENGRRRFHGAFTGGFSAGFWNTVGSLEGWKPQSFKSSRSEKADKRQQQLPTDFMDDEDLGEFGIAPQRIQAREDFSKTDESSSRKRKFPSRDSGAIPGVPVLHQLLEPAREKVAVRLLRRMGWKPNQGIGSRQTKREKTRSKLQNDREFYVMKMYGCISKPIDGHEKSYSKFVSDETDDDEEEEEEEEALTFAPDDYEPFVCSIKENVFGLGYSGLIRQIASETKSHINLFGPLEVLGKSNKKLSIRGQAFGVGALEEEDEDIYARDDMTNYDFSLGDKKKREKAKLPRTQNQGVLEGFAEPTNNLDAQKALHVVELKSNFQPRNWLQRKSRFDPLPKEKLGLLTQMEETKRRGLGRHDLNPNERKSILEGENKKEIGQNTDIEECASKKSYLQQISEKYKEREDKTKRLLELLTSKEDNFVKGGLVTSAGIEIMQPTELEKSVNSENQKVLSEAKKITKSLENTTGIFRPFAGNEAKQERYEKFLEANLQKEEDIKSFLSTIQPVHLSEWDREMEQKEFVQARSIYKPLNGMMSERFVSKSTVEVKIVTPTKLADTNIDVVVKRTKVLWKPHSLLCKRFNIPEPFGGTLVEPKVIKKNKFSVFDYIENSINSKKDFVTPVIIPKHIEKPKVNQVQAQTIDNVKYILSSDNEIVSTSKETQNELLSERLAAKKPISDKTKTKTELELRIEDSKNKHPSEKKDLFKYIFDSSSEDDEDGTNLEDRTERNTDVIIPSEIAECLVKPSVHINILRNNSPPRGIFAALFSKTEANEEEEESKVDETGETEKTNKITFKPRHERIKEETFVELANTYGPKIPNRSSQSTIETKDIADNDIDKRLVELLSSKPIKTNRIVEEWVEKISLSSKKSKKEKREKNNKHRKKKDEHKHKHKKSKKQKKEKK